MSTNISSSLGGAMFHGQAFGGGGGGGEFKRDLSGFYKGIYKGL